MCYAVEKRQLQQTIWPIAEEIFASRMWLNWMLSMWQFRLVHRKPNEVVHVQFEHELWLRVPTFERRLT